MPAPVPATPSPAPALASQLALVTGAARGLGRAIALVLAEQGARVVLNDIAPEPDAAETIAALGDRFVAYHQADVGDETAVEAMFAAISAQHGPLDILVNNAGTSRPQTIRETSLADWDALLRINLTSAFLCCRAAFAQMEPPAGRGGAIVNLSSVVAHQGALAGHVHYAATKSGLLGLTRTLARTGAPLGIRVNAVAPGIIDTELLRTVHGDEGIARLSAQVPLGLGKPRDVGLAVAFLCGEGGRYITGAVLDVNGGLHMR